MTITLASLSESVRGVEEEVAKMSRSEQIVIEMCAEELRAVIEKWGVASFPAMALVATEVAREVLTQKEEEDE